MILFGFRFHKQVFSLFCDFIPIPHFFSRPILVFFVAYCSRSIPVLLRLLVLGLQADQSRPAQSGGDGRNDTIGQLIEVLEPILQSADATLSEDVNVTLETGMSGFGLMD